MDGDRERNIAVAKALGWQEGEPYYGHWNGNDNVFMGHRLKDGSDYPMTVGTTVFFERGKPGTIWAPTKNIDQAMWLLDWWEAQGGEWELAGEQERRKRCMLWMPSIGKVFEGKEATTPQAIVTAFLAASAAPEGSEG